MSEPWYGRPERSPGAQPGEGFFDNPGEYTRQASGEYARSAAYSAAPRHGAAATATGARRAAAQHSSDDRRPADDRRPPPAPTAEPRRREGRSPWHWLLLIPIVLPLIPALYNSIEPTLFGLPFFYWAQLAFAFLATAIIAVVNLKVR